jgi:tetratricopeptide (TPR) repeat protein
MSRAARVLRCGIVALAMIAVSRGDALAFDLCGAANTAGAALPEANPLDPLVLTARATWERVYTPFRADTRRVTDLFVVGPTARHAGAAFPPYAAICETGGAPKLYVTYGLLELLRRNALYDESFLALILGHELGHRLHDFDAAGRWTAGAWTQELEEVADVHGAFLAAAAGYSTRQLACDDVMDLFLNVEAGVDDAYRSGRKGALEQVLRSFDVYESLYDVGAALTFADRDTTSELLGWVNDHMELHAKRVGEFLVLEALARMKLGIDEGRWVAVADVPGVALVNARCVPVYPSHTAFWDERLAQLNKDRTVTQGVQKDLAKAEALLREARSLGASDLVVESSLACVHFYAGQFKKAERALDKADKAAAGVAPAVREALTQDRALVAWGAWMEANRPPAADAPEGDRKTWGKALSGAARDFRAHPELAAWLKRLAAYPIVAAEAPTRGGGGRLCKRAPEVGPGPSTLPRIPPVPRSGGCPCGWSELHTLVGASPAERVTTCVPAGWAVGLRWVHLALPGLAKGRGLEQRLLLHDAVTGPLASLETWERGCDALLARGVSDRGLRAYVGRCAALGAEEVVVTADDDCLVHRAVIVGPPGG